MRAVRLIVRAVTAAVALVATTLVVAAGCNNPGNCPAATQVVPGGSCSGDNLQCPYTLAPAGAAADAGVATSCVCTGGKWSCPSSGDGGDDGSAADGGGDDGSPDAAGEASLGDAAAPDAPVDTGSASHPEAGTADSGGANDAGSTDAGGATDAPAG